MKSVIHNVAAAALAAIVLPQAASAEVIVGLTDDNSIVRFNSNDTSATSGLIAVTGLIAGDQLIGIDKRPSLTAGNGLLYAVARNGAAGRIYTIDPMTGVATPGAVLTADATDLAAPFPFAGVDGAFFGVDFNPTVDRLRVTSDSGQNLRINVDTGAVQLDVPLAYQPGDPNVGDAAGVDSVAYSNNDVDPATATTLRGTEVNNDVLVVHTNPNGGLLMTAISLPLPADGFTGYDISGLTGDVFFSFTGAMSDFSTLYGVGSGGLFALGDIGVDARLIGIAARIVGDQDIVVPEPAALALLGLGVLGLAGLRRRRA